MAHEYQLFYRPTCPFCVKVLTFMADNDITMTMRDISSEPDALAELIDVGGKRQVPCLFIDGQPLYESSDIIARLKHDFLG